MDRNSSSRPGSIRPDTFFDDPSTTDDELGDAPSTTFASSPPLAIQSPLTRLSIQGQRLYLGSSASPLASQQRAHTQLALTQGTPGFFGLTSTPNDSNVASPSRRSKGSDDDRSSYDASAEDMSVTGHARPMSITASRNPRVVHNSSPRSSVVDSRTNSKVDTLFTEHIADMCFTERENLHESFGDEKSLQYEKTQTQVRQRSTSAPIPRVVRIMPPPVDTSARCSIPDNIVRTPYTFRQKAVLQSQSPTLLRTSSSTGSRLLLFLRRKGGRLAPKVSHLIFPPIASNSESGNGHHVSKAAYDDEAFFTQLRAEWRTLRGRWRMLSARGLQGIAIVRGCGRFGQRVEQGRPAPSFAMTGQASHQSHTLQELYTSSQDALLWDDFQRSPSASRGKHTWTRWAHRNAAANADQITIMTEHGVMPGDASADEKIDLLPERESAPRGHSASAALGSDCPCGHDPCTAGLEFIEGWSAARLGIGLVTVMLLAVAAALLWILLGVNDAHEGGLHSAGSRLGTGLVLGGFVMIIGWTGLFGWLVLSWLIA